MLDLTNLPAIKLPTPDDIMRKLGFTQEDTGGYCMVYRKSMRTGGYWMITTVDGGAVPTHPNESILIGCYDANDEMTGYMQTKFQCVLDGTIQFK